MNEKRLDNRVVRAVSSALLCVGVIAITAELNADEIVHKFKNPSFSGVGTGAHYLTIENQEHARKKAIQDALEAARKAAEREADNPVRFGSFTLEGNVVTYEVITNADGTEFIRMTIVSSDGTETVIEIPIGTGSFGSDGDSGGDS
jgi:hypothetical protein